MDEEEKKHQRKLIVCWALVFVALLAFITIGVLGSFTRKVSICHVDGTTQTTMNITIREVLQHIHHPKDRASACEDKSVPAKVRPKGDIGPVGTALGEPDTETSTAEEDSTTNK